MVISDRCHARLRSAGVCEGFEPPVAEAAFLRLSRKLRTQRWIAAHLAAGVARFATERNRADLPTRHVCRGQHVWLSPPRARHSRARTDGPACRPTHESVLRPLVTRFTGNRPLFQSSSAAEADKALAQALCQPCKI